jgi:hypothetical protein
MRGTRTVLASGFLALVLITGSSARSAADDCLAEPNGPTPQGQHWYYRIDHANNGRQCWYLRAETGPVQKKSRQTEPNSSKAMAQGIPAPTRPTAPAAETPLKENTAPAAAPIPWLNVQRLPEPIPLVQPVTQQKPAAQTRSDGAAAVATSGSAVPEREIDPPAAVPNRPATSADSNATSAHRAREQQRRQPAQARPEPPIPVDHTFALLMIMFAALAIAGPALHFVERRRRRKAVNFRPPPRPRVVAVNVPTPRVGLMPRPRVAKPPAPMPIRPPDQTERLAHALQQLVDRLQTADRHEPRAVRVSPRGRASI